MNVFYFGCILETGHYLWDVRGRRIHDGHPLLAEVGFPVKVHVLDGGLLPYGRLHYPDGHAFVAHVNGWTILSFNDSSIDKRLGSHSVFVVKGVRAFDDAANVARGTFPEVWNRFHFTVREAVAQTQDARA